MAAKAMAGTITVVSNSVSGSPVPVYNLSAEGDLDWAKWGTVLATDYDHKYTGTTPLIPNVTVLGDAPAVKYFSGAAGSFTWVDGALDWTRTAVATGIYTSTNQVGAGFQLTVPASTTPTVLNLYVSQYKAIGKVDVQLSDGTPSISVTNPSGNAAWRYTINFAASAESSTLTVSHVIASASAGGNVTILAASLSSAATLPLSVPAPTMNCPSIVAAGSTFTLTCNPKGVGATGKASFAYQWQVSSNGSNYADLADATNNPLTIAASGPGDYNYRVCITNSALGAVVTSAPVALHVVTPSGFLAGGCVSVTTGTSVNLTSEGVTDWAHWGTTGPFDFDYKAGLIGNYSQIGAGSLQQYSAAVGYSWTDAATANNLVVSNTSCIGVPMTDSPDGFQVSIPATTSLQCAQVYLGNINAKLHVEASMSDGSAPFFTSDPSIYGTLRYTFKFKAASAGQTLNIRITSSQHSGANPAYSLESISLQPADIYVIPPPVFSPRSDVVSGENMTVSFDPSLVQGMIAPLTFQWLKNTGSGFINIPNATNATAAYGPAGAPGTEYVEVMVADSYGGLATSAPVALTVSQPTGKLKILYKELLGVPARTNDLTTEGDLDWIQWGLGNKVTMNRKATEGELISTYKIIGSGSAYSFANAPTYYEWSDGTPTATSTPQNTGVYKANNNNGFEIDVAAAQTNRVLHIYMGSYARPMHFTAALSDNTAASLVDDTIEAGTTYRVNIEFAAGTPGSNSLILKLTSVGSGGNVSIGAVTLCSSNNAPPLTVSTPVLAPTNSVVAGSAVTVSAAATGQPPLSYQWLVSANGGDYVPLASDYTNALALGKLFTTAPSVGTYAYKLVVTNEARGAVTSAPVTLTVTGPATSVLTSATSEMVGTTTMLDSEGTLDWVLFANTSYTNPVRSATGGSLITYSSIGSGDNYTLTLAPYNTSAFQWTNGVPDVSGITSNVMRVNAAGDGYELLIPAASNQRTFKLYCACRYSTMHIEAFLSDGSAPVFVDESFVDTTANSMRCYSFKYSSQNPGQYLVVRLWQMSTGWVGIGAATLSEQIPLEISLTPVGGGQLMLSWPAGILLEAPEVTGPWTTNTAVSPYTLMMNGPRKFFRIQQ